MDISQAGCSSDCNVFDVRYRTLVTGMCQVRDALRYHTRAPPLLFGGHGLAQLKQFGIWISCKRRRKFALGYAASRHRPRKITVLPSEGTT